MSLQLRSLCCWLCSLILSLCLFAMPADAQVLPGIPTTTYNGATIPDFNATSFNDLPPIQQGGVLQVPPATANQIGYDPSRQWQPGAAVGDVMQLGDFQDTFGLHQLTMRAISQLTGFSLNTFTLDNFPLLRSQNVSSLVQAIPGLKDLPLGQVAPLADLVQGSNPGGIGNLMNMPLGSIASNPAFGNLSLDNLQLNQYTFTQIPGLSDVNIGSLDGWQTLPVNGVPGLGDVSFGNFPINPFNFLGLIAIHDVTYGGDRAHKESRSTPTKFSISGSDQVGFHYPCAQSKGCDYIELNSPISLGIAGDPTGLHGARWIRGGTGPGEQMVKGGHGILGIINNGQEPTGRLPFGDVFKVVLTKTDEATGTGQFSLYFRVCHHGLVDLGCTPYFIGPIPFLGTTEKGLVFVGETPGTPPPGIQPPPIPPEVQQLIDQYDKTSNDPNCTIDPSKLDAASRAALSALPASEMGNAAKYMPDIMQACAQAGITDTHQLAYVLATAEHESAGFSTLSEYGHPMYDACGWGEGLVQVTWCTNKSKVFRNLGLSPYQGINDKRLEQPDIAAKALCSGMAGGWYTSIPLGSCISGSNVNLACARSVVNGDYGKVGPQINQYYAQFDKALSSGGSNTANTGINCNTPSAGGSPGTGSANEQKIMASVNQLRGMSSAGGPSGGNEACAWTVNQVLQNAGYAPLGTGGPTHNPNWVPDIDYDLSHGRGTLISPGQAQPGDIILSKGDEHIGFCINVGCTQVLSNSSSQHSFSWLSDGNFGGSYDHSKYLGEQPTDRIYRLNR